MSGPSSTGLASGREGWDVIVVGGGPAGLMAAGAAAEAGARVLLLERGPSPGRKLLVTASGRCNVTNQAPVDGFLGRFPAGQGPWLEPSVRAFPPDALRGWLAAHGVPTTEERKGRVFPAAQQARVVLDALLAWLRSLGVEMRTGVRGAGLVIRDGRLGGVRTEDGVSLAGPAVVLATGGLSWPRTGSTGDGYELARQAGHGIEEPFPALVGLDLADPFGGRLAGEPLKNVQLTLRSADGACLDQCFGEALWTATGLEGSAVMELSRTAVLALRAGHPVALELDLRRPDTAEALDRRLEKVARCESGTRLQDVFGRWLPTPLAGELLARAGLDGTAVARRCADEEGRAPLVALFKHLTLPLVGHRPIDEAIVTGGGIRRDEMDPATMGSRRLPGLHAAGEVLDVDGPTGGFNLQAAFSTGRLAGTAAAAYAARVRCMER